MFTTDNFLGAEVAYRQQKKSDALKHYRSYLKTAPKGTEEYKQVADRVAQLEKS